MQVFTRRFLIDDSLIKIFYSLKAVHLTINVREKGEQKAFVLVNKDHFLCLFPHSMTKLHFSTRSTYLNNLTWDNGPFKWKGSTQ